MFDTHCHLNFSRFKKSVDEVIKKAKDIGVSKIVIPGTDIPTSQKAIEIAAKNAGIYAAIGIHPHHVYELKVNEQELDINEVLKELEKIIVHEKVVAIGEIGMDRHVYENTKYEQYQVDEKFIDLQRSLFKYQVQMAIRFKKSLVVHNREAKADLLPILDEVWDPLLEYRSVFHCCEPDEELLEYARKHKMFIGVDGDITYYPEKQEFIKKVPLDMLVLETDAPFLLPEPLRTEKKFPNEPMNIKMIGEFIAGILSVSPETLFQKTTQNSKKLFNLS